MKRLLLLPILLCFSFTRVFAQDKETIYTDTIDIVEFFESVLKGENKYHKEYKHWSEGEGEYFGFDNKVITFKELQIPGEERL